MKQSSSLTPEPLLTSGEVGQMLRVDAKTVVRWVKDGKLGAILTPTGRYRFREAEVRALLNGGRS